MNFILKNKKAGFSFVIAAAVLSATQAGAVQVPSSVHSGQVEKRFEQPATKLSTPDFELPALKEGELSEEAKRKLEQSKFVLKKVEIDGATVFGAEEVEYTSKDKIGEKISLADAHGIAKAITSHYRKEGYILSQAVIPAQELNDGVLKVRVVEGYINGYDIKGDDISEGERSVIKNYAEKILKSRPVRTQDMERYLLLMNDLPGAKITGLLRPSANALGGADLVLTVSVKSFEGAYNVDNRGSKFIGPWQHTLTGVANSLLGMFDQTTLRVSTTNPTTELRSYELQHSQLLGSEGTTLSARAALTHTEPGHTLKPVGIVGDSTLFEALVQHPFIRSREENLISRFAFEWHDTDTDVFKDIDFTQDRLRMVRLGTYYGFFDDYKGSNTFDVQLTQGLDVFNSSDKGVNRSNTIGESDFTKVNFDVSRLQGLFGQFSLLAAVSGQYSFDPLLVAEQFSLGGPEFGRAYDPAEVLGDSGVIGKLELRFDDYVGAEYFQDYQLYTYYDIGRAWLRDVPSAANEKLSMASAGVGVRAGVNDNLYGSVELSVPLTKEVATERNNDNDPRLFFSLSAKF